MNWFTGAFASNKQSQQQQPQQQPQNIPNNLRTGGQQNNPQNQPNGNQGNNNNNQGNGQNANPNEPTNPLDVYGKMFDNPANPDTPPAFNIDPKVMDNVVGSQDFMRGIDPELMNKALAGDVKSMMDIIQSSNRNVYRAAIEHGGVLTDKFVGAREAYSGKTLPSRVKEELTNQELSNTPNYKHPVVQKQLTEIATRLQRLHPDAAPREIARMAKEYLSEIAKVIQDTGEGNGNQVASKETNWDEFFADDANS